MTTASIPDTLPISEILEPTSQEEAAEFVKQCAATETPIYPLGGGTSLDYGLAPRREGVGLSLAKLDRLIDYPARDMTITVEAGLTMQRLATALAENQQRLPIDAPEPSRATIGGVVATNSSGSLRYSHGGVRDHVIGIAAIDGRGMPFRGGGCVVKNVAGYDFCKLLTGSLGTLGIITQLTLKLKPIPSERAVVVGRPRDLEQSERILSALSHSQTTPAAIELLGGPAWQGEPSVQTEGEGGLALAVVLEGTKAEVDWMVSQLEEEWRAHDVIPSSVQHGDEARSALDLLGDFPGQTAPLVAKVSVLPSHTTAVIDTARCIDPNCSFQAHAGNGVIIIRFSEFPSEGLGKTIIGQLQPAAAAGQGHLVILSNPSGVEATRLSVWGINNGPFGLMSEVKRQFDPAGILNPGRFVYES